MKNANPFADYDFTKVWGDFPMPALDADAIVAAHQRNLEALSIAGRVAVEGIQAVTQRQAEIVRDTLEQTAAAAQGLAKPSNPEEMLAQQAKFAKSVLQTGLDNAREITGMAAKAANEAVDVVNKRFVEGLDEFEGVFANGKAPAKATVKAENGSKAAPK